MKREIVVAAVCLVLGAAVDRFVLQAAVTQPVANATAAQEAWPLAVQFLKNHTKTD